MGRLRSYEKSEKGKAKMAAYHAAKAPEKKLREQLRRYGLSVAVYQDMLAVQGGVCAICLRPPVGRRLSVDHCHETGRIRGLLCHNCNVSLGLMGDSPDRLRSAVAYLEKNNAD